MKIFLPFIMLFFLIACNSNSAVKTKKSVSKPEYSAKPSKNSVAIPDSVNRFAVDDYPVSDQQLRGRSKLPVRSGAAYSTDKAWFRNETLRQTLVFDLYTDLHRLRITHFYSDTVPFDIIDNMELMAIDKKPAPNELKRRSLNGFLDKADRIPATSFTSDKGFKLGDNKNKALKIYGKPTEETNKKGIDKLVWKFAGDMSYTSSDSGKGPFAKDSFGHEVTMYFRDGRLIAVRLFNDIP